jgi:hypothetical protein
MCSCGFRGLGVGADSGVPGSDGGAGDLASGAGDLAAPAGGNGPGPLGALPTGFCCAANEQCRSRQCFSFASGPYYCADFCDTTLQCSGFSTQFTCDPNGSCAPINDSYSCLDGATYSYGSKPTGACCDGAAQRPGQECLGGWCLRTGATTDPFYCTQGCNNLTACPAGYTCHSLGPGLTMQGQCWKNNATSCQ